MLFRSKSLSFSTNDGSFDSDKESTFTNDNSSSSSNFYFNSMVDSNNVKIVETVSVMFMNVSAGYEIAKKSKGIKSIQKIKSINSLDSIDENKILQSDNFLVDRQVKIVSLIVPHSGAMCADYVASHLHEEISKHPKFTCMENIPYVLREAYPSVDSKFIKKLKDNSLNDESGCSVITAIINSKNEICISHVGEVRAVVQGIDEKILELSQSHTISKVNYEQARLIKNKVTIDNNGRIFNKYHYGRAFGHKSAKEACQDGLICLPCVIHIKINFDNAKNKKLNSSMHKSGNIMIIFGTSSIWNKDSDKKLCSSLNSAFKQGKSIQKRVSKLFNPTYFQKLFSNSTKNNIQIGKGICIFHWMNI